MGLGRVVRALGCTWRKAEGGRVHSNCHAHTQTHDEGRHRHAPHDAAEEQHDACILHPCSAGGSGRRCCCPLLSRSCGGSGQIGGRRDRHGFSSCGVLDRGGVLAAGGAILSTRHSQTFDAHVLVECLEFTPLKRSMEMVALVGVVNGWPLRLSARRTASPLPTPGRNCRKRQADYRQTRDSQRLLFRPALSTRRRWILA
jgi:hypothetical protein